MFDEFFVVEFFVFYVVTIMSSYWHMDMELYNCYLALQNGHEPLQNLFFSSKIYSLTKRLCMDIGQWTW